jgi:hypothetical protein
VVKQVWDNLIAGCIKEKQAGVVTKDDALVTSTLALQGTPRSAASSSPTRHQGAYLQRVGRRGPVPAVQPCPRPAVQHISKLARSSPKSDWD